MFPTPPESPEQKVLLRKKSNELSKKKQNSYDNCCCTVKITPDSKVEIPTQLVLNSPNLNDDDGLLFCQNSSWTSCMCGMPIPYISYSDTAS